MEEQAARGPTQEKRPRWLGLLGRFCLRYVLFFLLLDLILFFIFDILPDPAVSRLGLNSADPELVESFRQQAGISGNWHERLLGHWSQIIQGNMGKTLSGNLPIANLLLRGIRYSLPIWLSVMLLIVLIPLPLGLILGSSRFETGRRAFTILITLFTAPQFISATTVYILWLLLSFQWQAFTTDIARWFFIILGSAALPVGVLLLASTEISRKLIALPFVSTYHSIGMAPHAIYIKLAANVFHELRPLIARLIIGVFVGNIFTELLFDIQGFGHSFIDGIRSGDANLMRSWMFVAGSIVCLFTSVERAPNGS